MKPVEQVIDEQIEIYVEGQRQTLIKFLERCESPLERLFALTMVAPAVGSNYFWLQAEPCEAGWLHGEVIGAEHIEYRIEANPTIEANGHKYRPDFLFSFYIPLCYEAAFRFGVEIDGHDFHEKTKSQAEHDNQRDRALLAVDLRLLRFTGREIAFNLRKVCHEIGDFIFQEGQKNKLWTHFGAREPRDFLKRVARHLMPKIRNEVAHENFLDV